MAYSAFSVVFGETPSAAKWNLLGANDATFNDFITGATSSGQASTTYAPTYVNVTVGGGTLVAKYNKVGRWVDVEWNLLCNVGTTSVGSSVTVSLPVTAASKYSSMSQHPVGVLTGEDAGTKIWQGTVLIDNSTSVFEWRWDDGAGGLSTTIPFAEATGDTFSFSARYEAAT